MSCRYSICACDNCMRVAAVVDAARVLVDLHIGAVGARDECLAKLRQTVRALDGGDQ